MENTSVVMEILSYPTETVLSNKINRNRIVLSFKDNALKPLKRRPKGKFRVEISISIRSDCYPSLLPSEQGKLAEESEIGEVT